VSDKLQAIQERHQKATPGPYRWDINKTCHTVLLTTTHSGQYYILTPRRWGTRGAMLEFQKYDKYEGPVRERGSQGMQRIEEFTTPRAAHHAKYDMYIDHPDAIAIEKSWEDVEFLLQEVERLQTKVEELQEYNPCQTCHR
jgi:hypothetical protein